MGYTQKKILFGKGIQSSPELTSRDISWLFACGGVNQPCFKATKTRVEDAKLHKAFFRT